MKKYPKLNPQDKCAFPKRKDCNYNDKEERCKYMKYDNSCSIFDSNRWKCTYKQMSPSTREGDKTKQK